jgi:uncharacterized protein (DUF1697 family)
MRYAVLFRGINVGGKNRVLMARLRKYLEETGYRNVTTYIASGNVILESDRTANDIKLQLESTLPETFKLDDELVKVLVLTHRQLQAIVDNRPEGFGDKPDTYHSDAIFLMDMDSAKVMSVFHPREGVDKVWPGNGVIYSQRLSSQRTKSRLSKIMAAPEYKSMTIRSWSTTTALLGIMNK